MFGIEKNETNDEKIVNTIKKIYNLEEEISKEKQILAASALGFGAGVIALLLGKDAVIREIQLNLGLLDMTVQEAAQTRLAGNIATIAQILTLLPSSIGLFIGGKSIHESRNELKYYKNYKENLEKLVEEEKGRSL